MMNRLSLLSFLLPATICFAGPIVEVGGITFQQVFKESKGSESLHEYLPPGEKLDSWTKLVAFREFSKPREPKAYIENLATVYRKKFPHMQFAVFQDVSTGDWMIDYFAYLKDEKPKYIEWNFFRARKAKKGIVVFQYAVRIFHDGWVLKVKDEMKSTRIKSLEFLLPTWFEEKPNSTSAPASVK